MNDTDKKTLMKRLAAPFPASAIHVRLLQSGVRDNRPWGLATPYVRASAIIERLNEEVPFDHSTTVEVVAEDHVKTRLTIAGVTHEEIGEPAPGQGDRLKSAASDALKRAAMRFGIGLDLKAITPILVTGPADLEVRGKDRVVLTQAAEARLTAELHKAVWKHYLQRGVDAAKMQTFFAGNPAYGVAPTAPATPPSTGSTPTDAAPAAPLETPPAPAAAAPTTPTAPSDPPPPAVVSQVEVVSLFDTYGTHIVEYVLRQLRMQRTDAGWQIPQADWGVVQATVAQTAAGRSSRRRAG